MKHLRIYENFDDDLTPLTRDFFDLTSQISLGHGFSLSGPKEHEEAASAIAEILKKYLDEEAEAFSSLAMKGMIRGKRQDFLEYSLSVDHPKELEALTQIGYTYSIKPNPRYLE